MAHFYGTINGAAKTMASRTGTKNSGIESHIRGWDIGCRVFVSHCNGLDVVTVYRTGGSNGATSEIKIAEFTNQPESEGTNGIGRR